MIPTARRINRKAGKKAAMTLGWEPPDAHSIKLNVDGSFSLFDGVAGVGVVLRDHDVGIVFSACRNLRSCVDALEAKLVACEDGLRAVVGWTDKVIVLEFDCTEALAMICAKSHDRSSHACNACS